MLRHVDQRLQSDPEGCDLGGGRQVAQRFRDLEPQVEPAQDPLGAVAEGGLEAELVEHGRPQVVHQAPDVADRGGEHRAELVEHPARGVRLGRAEVAGGLRRESGRREGRAELVVEVGGEPPALLLPGEHELLP